MSSLAEIIREKQLQREHAAAARPAGVGFILFLTLAGTCFNLSSVITATDFGRRVSAIAEGTLAGRIWRDSSLLALFAAVLLVSHFRLRVVVPWIQRSRWRTVLVAAPLAATIVGLVVVASLALIR